VFDNGHISRQLKGPEESGLKERETCSVATHLEPFVLRSSSAYQQTPDGLQINMSKR